MTKLLVSVRNADEADQAVAGGADLVDIKEPTLGSLGAASLSVIHNIARQYKSRATLSAACGELLDECFDFENLPPQLALAKIGLGGCAEVPDWRPRLRRARSRIPVEIEHVGVVYADWCDCSAPSPEEVIEDSAEAGCRYLLIDTFTKGSSHDLPTVVPPASLERWIRRAREGKLGVVLAGSLRLETISWALRWNPDFIAVRGAACRHGRTGAVCELRVRQLRDAIHLTGDSTANSQDVGSA